MSEKCLTWNVTVVAEALAGRSTKSVCSRPLGAPTSPARVASPSSVTVFLPYKSTVTVRPLGIRQRARFDASPARVASPSAVTVFLYISMETDPIEERGGDQRYSLPKGLLPNKG